jgi:uncharacterized protein
MEIEKRTFNFVCEDRKMQGHAAVFGQVADLGWMKETIEPGAFKSSIKKDDVRALFNHDPNFVLGRSTSGTLKMSEDDIGLKISIDPPDTQFARDLAVSIERGDINQMSFAFQVQEEEWQRGEGKEPDRRILKKVKLFDVSPVTYPAYEGTDIAMRSHDAWKKELEENENKTKIKEEKEKPQSPDVRRLNNNKKRTQLLRKTY